MKTVLIMAGGEGTRFWPLSRKSKPKQFLKLADDEKTMLQLTVERVMELVDINKIFIATNGRYINRIIEQLPAIPEENIIEEPYKRNTAPSIALSSLYINRKYPDSTMTILPSDHIIKDNNKFLEVLDSAIAFVQKGTNMVTLGIKPDHPETGYGYIKLGTKAGTIEGNDIFKVKKFTEKPDLKTANVFFEGDNYYWNSGMFIWKSSTILKKIEKYLPEIYNSINKISKSIGEDNEKDIIKEEFKKMDSISIDYGILEKDNEIFTIPVDFGWNDVGSWPALSEMKEGSCEDNVIKADHLGINTKRSIIYSQDKLITTVGIDNLIIVNTEDVVLVCNKDDAQDVKKLRELLKKKGLHKYL